MSPVAEKLKEGVVDLFEAGNLKPTLEEAWEKFEFRLKQIPICYADLQIVKKKTKMELWRLHRDLEILRIKRLDVSIFSEELDRLCT